MHPDDFAYPWCSLRTDLLLLRRLRAMRGGVVIGTRPSFNLLAAALAPGGHVTVAQEHMNFNRHRKGLARDVRRRYRGLGALAVLTEDDRRDYEGALGGATRVVRLPNAVPPLGGERARPESKVVVAAGRLNSAEGLRPADRGVEAGGRRAPRLAAADLRPRAPARGAQAPGPRRRAGRRRLPHGRHARPRQALAQGSAFVLSSRYEGFGIVVVEAMSKGMAVVSFDCPRGPGEIIDDGRDGVLVPDGDVAALSRALLDVVGDEERRRALGAAAVESARRYDPAVVGKDWVSLIDELAPRVP